MSSIEREGRSSHVAPAVGQIARGGATSAVVLLTLANFMSMFDRVQLSALLPPIKQEFGLTDGQLGILTGLAFSLMYASVALPVAWISDRTNRARLLAAALSLWSLMTVLSGLAASYLHLVAARIGLAVGESAMTPTAHSILADYYPPHRRALPIGIETAGASFGVFAGLAVAGWAGTHLGWRHALMIAGAPGFVLAVAIVLLMREPPRSAFSAGKGERARLKAAVQAVFRAPGLPWLILAAVLNSSMTTGLGQWVPSFFARTHDMSLAAVGVSVGAALGLGTGFGHVFGGWIFNRLAGRRADFPFRYGALASLFIVPFYLTALWAPHPVVGLLCIAICNFIAGSFVPMVFSGVQNVCDPRFRATTGACVLLCTVLGAYGATPTAIGLLSDALTPALGVMSLRGAMTVMAAAPLVLAVAHLKIGSRMRQLFAG